MNPELIRLETPRLILRRFGDGDLEPFLRYRNDPDVARYQGWDIPYSRESAEFFIAEMKREAYARPGVWFQLAIGLKPVVEAQPAAQMPEMSKAEVLMAEGFKSQGFKTEGIKSEEIMIGDVGFVLLQEEPRQAEIGFSLDRAYHHQGYAREAVTCLLDHLFGEFSLHRVRANCDPENQASANLLKRLGFRHEGRMVESMWFKGRWADEDWYAVLASEWRKNRRAGQ